MLKLDIDTKDFGRWLDRFRWSVKQRPQTVRDALDQAAAIIYRRAKINVTGRILGKGGPGYKLTGRLGQSLLMEPAKKVGNVYVSRIGNKLSPVNYGASWEFGFTTKEIRPIKAKALHWVSRSGQHVFAMRRPAMSFPARPWLWPAFADSSPEVQALLEAAGARFINDANK